VLVTLSFVIARKEIRDHLRDTRALLSSAFMALMGPAVVLLVSLSDRAPGQDGARVFVGMLTIFALVSAFAGAIDVAMDSTAGERERRSLIPLLLNPVTRSEIVLGKWIAVTAFALGAVALNSAALVAVLAWAAPALLAARADQIAMWILLGLAPLTALGAAANLFVAVLCRSTKEAHTALRFLAFVPMLIGMFLVFFPSWTGRAWFVLPIVGQQTLIALREPSAPIAASVILALVTLVAAIGPLVGATRVLSRDDILSA
jgi:sodium transport system permease protein